MEHVVLNRRHLLPAVLRRLLSEELLGEISASVPEGMLVEEIRLRRGRCASVTVEGKNLRLPTVLEGAEMERLLVRMCEGSVYAHEETLKAGYLVLPDGVRVGVGGRAVTAGGVLLGITDLTAFSIRIPSPLAMECEEICKLLRSFSLSRGVLVYAPPGVGKTTLLRGAAASLSGGETPLRVAVVDTRGELVCDAQRRELLLDLLSGYPRGLGISIATRTLSAEVIVCDEIGDLAEAQEIVNAHNGGVPLLASAHAGDLRELLARPGMRLLHEARCFGAYARLFRREGGGGYRFVIHTWEEADALF